MFHVEFKSRSAQAIESARKVGKEQLPSLQLQLKSAEDSLMEVSREIDFARRQEALLREAGERTASRIQWFGILSISILLITSLWQLVYLRHFFSSKKLI